jgi:amidohydrolase
VRDIEALAPELVAWRRDFHRHPELAFQEQRTSAVVRSFLEAHGIEVRACGGATGLRGVLKGPAGGPVSALRADMDALPVAEETDHGFPSETPGVMHACGHDGHMSILMGAARILSAHRGLLKGDVVFLFQPSEEKYPGGAPGMIEDGALDGVSRVFGLHLWQPLPSGVVGTRPGPMMAQSDEFEVVVRGKGGHASQPHLTVDPVLAASQLVVAAQAVVSRNTDPIAAAVVSFTTIHGGHAFNIIPDSVTLTGTVRTFEPQVQRTVKARLAEVCEHTGRAVGANVELKYTDGYPPLVNDPAMVDVATGIAAREFGADRVRAIPPSMGGEDFAYYLQRAPGAFFMLGIGDNRPYPHHSSHFDIDESVLPTGVRLLTAIAVGLQ